MISRKEMRRLLEILWRDYVVQFKNEDLEVYKSDLETYRAILAALEERRILLEILPAFVDDEPCRFDHHGNCQEHNINLASEGDCPMPTLRRILAGQAELNGPSEEERKRLSECLYFMWSTYEFKEIRRKDYETILALILGNPAPEKEKK